MTIQNQNIMRSLTHITHVLLQITSCMILFISCSFKSDTKSKVKHAGERIIVIKTHAKADTLVGSSFLKVIEKLPEENDTLYLKPEDIFINPKFDTLYRRDQALVYGNFNPTFVNLLYEDHFFCWTFAKSTNPTSGDIEVTLNTNSKIYKQPHSYLFITQKGKGSYQNNPWNENKNYDIQFTPKFAAILQNLKYQK